MTLLDFKQLEAFINVADLGSFSRAAEKLYLTQPTISAHISSLEKELGASLIVRTPKEAYLTDTGKLLYGYASDIITLRDNAISICQNKEKTISGSIAIAASTIPYQYLLPKLTSEFRAIYPDVTFRLISGDSAGVVSAILSGKADIGMTGAIMDSYGCVYENFAEDTLVVVTPNSEPYLSLPQNSFSLEQLTKFPFIMREPGSGTRKETEAYLMEKGIRLESLKIAAQMDNPDAIKKSISQGLGISIMSGLSAADYESFGLVRLLHPESNPILRKLYIVRHKSRPLSPAAEAFATFVKK